MKNSKNIYLILLFMISNIVFAQSIKPPKPRATPPGLPIDTSLWILGLVAIGFGVYLIIKKRLKQIQ